jgi:bacterioferritin
VQRLAKVKIGETVPEQFKLDLALEIDAVSLLNKTIALASEVRDHGTRELLEGILRSEEDHVEWLETQLRLLKQLGEPVYLAEQIS